MKLKFVILTSLVTFNAAAFDFFTKELTPDRLLYVTDLLGTNINNFKCPVGLNESAPNYKSGLQIYVKMKKCKGLVDNKNIELDIQAYGGDLIGFASSIIDESKVATCDSYRNSQNEYEKDFFKSGRIIPNINGVSGFYDVQKKSVKHKRVFSCQNGKIMWIAAALPIDFDISQFGTTSKNKLSVYALSALLNLHDQTKNLSLDLTSKLALYQKDLEAGLSQKSVDEIRKKIKSNDNYETLLKIYDDLVDAAKDMNRAREFLTQQK